MDISTLDEHVGNQLRLRRTTLKISQRELAELADIAPRQLQKYEQGINKIGASRLYLFSRLLNIDLLYFFDGFIKEGNNEIRAQYDICNINDKEMINELIPAFILLPHKTKENLLKLVKDISSTHDHNITINAKITAEEV